MELKTNVLLIISIFALLPTAVAHGEDDFVRAEQIITDSSPCDKLNNEELALMGDYYMEQMHPGDLHEVMDQRMGGEGSEALRQVHISMARSFYCGEHDAMSTGMMKVLMGRNLVMNDEVNRMTVDDKASTHTYGYGMMGVSAGYGWHWLGVLYWLIIIVAMALIIWWLVNLNQSKKGERPLDVLQKRYVRGELNKKQYDKMRKELG